MGTPLPAGQPVYDAHYWLSEGVAVTPVYFEQTTVVTDSLRDQSRARLKQI